MNFKSHIPNFLTCINLTCGCAAIPLALAGDLSQLAWASCLIGIASLFDFFDGLAARALHVYSEFGKQLDSLADMVSFGVVPGLILYEIILINSHGAFDWMAYSGLLIPLFSALRLAKFNIDINQSESFIGLPTPANALFIGSLPLIIIFDEYQLGTFIGQPITLSIISVVLAFLLVSPLKLFSLKMKSPGWKNNKLQYVFLVMSLLIIAVFHFIAIPIIVILYLIVSTVNIVFKPSD